VICAAISDLDAPKRRVAAQSVCHSLTASVSWRYVRYTDQMLMFVRLESRNRMAAYLKNFKLNSQNQNDMRSKTIDVLELAHKLRADSRLNWPNVVSSDWVVPDHPSGEGWMWQRLEHPNTGSTVRFSNGGYQVSYDNIPEIARSHVVTKSNLA
jgi:hypothetical protein